MPVLVDKKYQYTSRLTMILDMVQTCSNTDTLKSIYRMHNAQVILYSEGFAGAKDLASKIVSLFTLSKQLLSRQQHYDWGLRALKAALNTGGKLIQVTITALLMHT
jgi:Hydrolytic ATP binding site of dynein motor region